MKSKRPAKCVCKKLHKTRCGSLKNEGVLKMKKHRLPGHGTSYINKSRRRLRVVT